MAKLIEAVQVQLVMHASLLAACKKHWLQTCCRTSFRITRLLWAAIWLCSVAAAHASPVPAGAQVRKTLEEVNKEDPR